MLLQSSVDCRTQLQPFTMHSSDHSSNIPYTVNSSQQTCEMHVCIVFCHTTITTVQFQARVVSSLVISLVLNSYWDQSLLINLQYMQLSQRRKRDLIFKTLWYIMHLDHTFLMPPLNTWLLCRVAMCSQHKSTLDFSLFTHCQKPLMTITCR